MSTVLQRLNLRSPDGIVSCQRAALKRARSSLIGTRSHASLHCNRQRVQWDNNNIYIYIYIYIWVWREAADRAHISMQMPFFRQLLLIINRCFQNNRFGFNFAHQGTAGPSWARPRATGEHLIYTGPHTVITICSQNELRVTKNIYIWGDEIIITKMSEEI